MNMADKIMQNSFEIFKMVRALNVLKYEHAFLNASYGLDLHTRKGIIISQ